MSHEKDRGKEDSLILDNRCLYHTTDSVTLDSPSSKQVRKESTAFMRATVAHSAFTAVMVAMVTIMSQENKVRTGTYGLAVHKC